MCYLEQLQNAYKADSDIDVNAFRAYRDHADNAALKLSDSESEYAIFDRDTHAIMIQVLPRYEHTTGTATGQGAIAYKEFSSVAVAFAYVVLSIRTDNGF